MRSCSDDDVEHNIPLRQSSAAEHWVYIEPPVERADTETDHHSGAKRFFYCRSFKMAGIKEHSLKTFY